MDRQEAFKKISKVVAGQLSLDESEIQENSSFTADLGADSLDTVELVMAFEDEFGKYSSPHSRRPKHSIAF